MRFEAQLPREVEACAIGDTIVETDDLEFLTMAQSSNRPRSLIEIACKCYAFSFAPNKVETCLPTICVPTVRGVEYTETAVFPSAMRKNNVNKCFLLLSLNLISLRTPQERRLSSPVASMPFPFLAHYRRLYELNATLHLPNSCKRPFRCTECR